VKGQPSASVSHSLLKRLLSKGVDALALRLCLDSQLLVNLRRDAQIEFAREVAARLNPLFLANLLQECSDCGLTARSSGAPTAGHQARSGGTRYTLASAGLAYCRCRPLSSKVERLSSGIEAVRAEENRPQSCRPFGARH